MAWRLAESLNVLRLQVNALAPQRSKVSDGTIGDAAHRHRPSRHNPNSSGVVCALDLTDDPANGCPIHAIAERVRRNPHPNLAYIISNRRIASRSTGWRWHTYTGSNPHSRHVHFAVGVGPDSAPRPPYNDRTPWAVVSSGKGGPPVETAGGGARPRKLRRGMKGPDVKALQKILIGSGHLGSGGADGVFGPKTEAAVKKFQAKLGVTADGIVGPVTHAAIARLFAWLEKSVA